MGTFFITQNNKLVFRFNSGEYLSTDKSKKCIIDIKTNLKCFTAQKTYDRFYGVLQALIGQLLQICKPFQWTFLEWQKRLGRGFKGIDIFRYCFLYEPTEKPFTPHKTFFYSFSIHIHLYHPLTPHKQVGKVNIKLYMIRSDNILCHIKEACPF